MSTVWPWWVTLPSNFPFLPLKSGEDWVVSQDHWEGYVMWSLEGAQRHGEQRKHLINYKDWLTYFSASSLMTITVHNCIRNGLSDSRTLLLSRILRMLSWPPESWLWGWQPLQGLSFLVWKTKGCGRLGAVLKIEMNSNLSPILDSVCLCSVRIHQ